MLSKYYIVRVPYGFGKVQLEHALRSAYGDAATNAVEVAEVAPGDDDAVREIRALYAADNYDDGDDIRVDVEEGLYHAFTGIVPD